MLMFSFRIWLLILMPMNPWLEFETPLKNGPRETGQCYREEESITLYEIKNEINYCETRELPEKTGIMSEDSSIYSEYCHL